VILRPVGGRVDGEVDGEGGHLRDRVVHRRERRRRVGGEGDVVEADDRDPLYWLFSPRYGLINAALEDLGIIEEPILWLGVNPTTSLWAVIISITWKVIGFGMILFVAAIQAVPKEVNEAALVDGASGWQRTMRVTLPLTMRTVLLVTLISVIGSLLAFDQFFLMTAGQPLNKTATSVFYIYLNTFPFLHLGYGAALSLMLAGFVLFFTITQMVVSRRSAR
jgi:multiple sugar transport system permease protein